MNLTKTEALAALDALAKNCDCYVEEAARYIELTSIIPEWLNSYRPNRWFVRHNYRTYETTAASKIDAINCVRYRIYGETPESALAPFLAVCPFEIIADAARTVRINEGREDEESRTTTDLFGRHTISKNEAIMRLKKMMRKAS